MMKVFSLLLTLIAPFIYTSCSRESVSDTRDNKLELLTADTWLAEQVLHNDLGDITDLYEDFTLTFLKPTSLSAGIYLITDGGDAFPDTMGQWQFNDDKTKLLLSDGKEIDFTVTRGTLTLEFHIPPSGQGRVNGLDGNFIFVMTRK